MDKNLSLLEKRVELSKLFDFYGCLLKENQKNIFEDYVFNDYSISEIASEYGITRQGIFDTVKRCSKSLNDYEEKLGLIKKFEETKSIVEEIHSIATHGSAPELSDIEVRTQKILDIL